MSNDEYKSIGINEQSDAGMAAAEAIAKQVDAKKSENKAVIAAPTLVNGVRSADMTLPSLGRFYLDAEGKELIPGGKIRVKVMTTLEESILFGDTTNNSNKINEIINSVAVLPNSITPGKLLITDRLAILVHCRLNTFGKDLSCELPHAKCTEKNNITHTVVDLVEDLDIKTPEAGLAEPFPIELPMSKSTVSVRFLRGDDEETIRKKSKKISAKAGGLSVSDPAYLTRLALHIREIDGRRVGFQEAYEFVKCMEAMDSLKLANTINKAESGLDLELVFDCGRCGAEDVTTFLPFDSEFFRPSSI